MMHKVYKLTQLWQSAPRSLYGRAHRYTEGTRDGGSRTWRQSGEGALSGQRDAARLLASAARAALEKAGAERSAASLEGLTARDAMLRLRSWTDALARMLPKEDKAPWTKEDE